MFNDAAWAGDMELRHIRYFMVLSEELHFTRAADRCGVSQPCLSAAIRKMEAELGGVLIHRRPHPQLSELGRALRPLWSEALRNVEHSYQVAHDHTPDGVHGAPIVPEDGVDAPPSVAETEVSLVPVREAMERIAAEPAPPTVPFPIDEPRDERGEAIVARMRDRLLVASCRARGGPFVQDHGLFDAAAWLWPRARRRFPAFRQERLRKVLVAAVTVAILAAAVFLFGRISSVKALELGHSAGGADASLSMSAGRDDPAR